MISPEIALSTKLSFNSHCIKIGTRASKLFQTSELFTCLIRFDLAFLLNLLKFDPLIKNCFARILIRSKELRRTLWSHLTPLWGFIFSILEANSDLTFALKAFELHPCNKKPYWKRLQHYALDWNKITNFISPNPFNSSDCLQIVKSYLNLDSLFIEENPSKMI